MAIRISTEACDDYLLVRVSGTLTPDDLTALGCKAPFALEAAPAESSYRGIVDLSASTFALPQHSMVDFALRVASLRRPLRYVIVAASDFQYASARQFVSIVESRTVVDSRVQLHVARDTDRALAWLARANVDVMDILSH